MSAHDEAGRERVRGWMMAALDGEIAPDERRELDRALAADPELRREWERLSRVKEVTSAMGLRQPPPELWGTYWTSVYRRVERGIAWILVSLGTTVLLGYGIWKWVEALFGESDVPLGIRLAVLALGLGGLLLLGSVAREKLFLRRRDPYREVQR